MAKETKDKKFEKWEKLLEKLDESLKKTVPASKLVQISGSARIIVQEYEKETGEKLAA